MSKWDRVMQGFHKALDSMTFVTYENIGEFIAGVMMAGALVIALLAIAWAVVCGLEILFRRLR